MHAHAHMHSTLTASLAVVVWVAWHAGPGKTDSDAAAIRSNNPIPPACGVYYFEIEVVSKGRDGYMGVGMCWDNVQLGRLPGLCAGPGTHLARGHTPGPGARTDPGTHTAPSPVPSLLTLPPSLPPLLRPRISCCPGWEPNSFGYHADDGNAFCQTGTGKAYGPTYTTGDVVGCGINFVDNTIFYTKNGAHLGTVQGECRRGGPGPQTLNLEFACTRTWQASRSAR